ncbi:MAG: hypothetical protein H7259_08375 [Cytophagales bacterium]|nr:hypothetical protein [Cytophaga sp.]
MKQFSLLVSVLFFYLLSVTTIQAQCAMCAASLESSKGEGMNSGINSGILYLMLFPYILIGTIGFIWYRSYKKNKEKTAGL